MCTVTFIPKSSNEFILTSNRDEAPGRVTKSPGVYEISGTKLLFPKDKVAGGTWIGLSEKKRLICLLNGGFTAHERAASYRLSRGVIVTDLLTSENAVKAIDAYDFDGIEPFTIILVDWSQKLQLYELVWDGKTSHFSEKPLTPHIWSSSLLYSEATKKKRTSWFSDFLLKHPNVSETELLHFHKTAGDGNLQTDLVMDRSFVKTKSITQVVHTSKTSMRYEDLQQQLTSKISL
ncbi:NRDE family protein [Jejudonia soesokkakensis]|uniref:NRDE family protein n=1 Tax=Jejudonia soesokkakensis TaxID=1323432 RepID=A0ABW2MSN8_9FLAO